MHTIDVLVHWLLTIALYETCATQILSGQVWDFFLWAAFSLRVAFSVVFPHLEDQ